MKVDVTSMFFNSYIEGKTATPAWGTSIGQNASKSCRIETNKDGVTDFIVGMAYKSSTRYDLLDISKGSGNRQLLMLASFDKVYVNNHLLPGARYHVILVKELSDSHYGRLIVSYAPYIKYDNYVNDQTIALMRDALKCSSEGCWFVYDIAVKNQDELHFSAVVVNAEHPMVYQGTSRERSLEWNNLIGREDVCDTPSEKQSVYYGCPGSGKSFKLKDNLEKLGVDELHQKRVTFHPDTDYASFVGCYKPISVQYKANKQPILDYNGLVDRLKEYLEVKPTNITKACTLFGYDYHDSIVMMQEDNGHTIPQLVADAYKNGTTYDSQVRAGMSVYETSAHDTSIDSGISYSFCPQVFTQAYVQAWQNLNENVYLVIEEINRGNCAQIFGDLFQLLDRNNEGYSEYKVTADKDLADYLIGVLGAEHDGIKDGKLCLPPNLIIYATMNTSDQSLFPMDSAFKRRWEWEYVPIDYSENVKSGKFEITIGDKVYSWVKFLEIVNDKIYDATNSEDKQMGNFFIKKSIDAATFVNKVMFYLWNEVCKEEYGTQRNFFRKGKEGKDEFKFTELFGSNRDTILNEFMSSLNVPTLNKEPENTEA